MDDLNYIVDQIKINNKFYLLADDGSYYVFKYEDVKDSFFARVEKEEIYCKICNDKKMNFRKGGFQYCLEHLIKKHNYVIKDQHDQPPPIQGSRFIEKLVHKFKEEEDHFKASNRNIRSRRLPYKPKNIRSNLKTRITQSIFKPKNKTPNLYDKAKDVWAISPSNRHVILNKNNSSIQNSSCSNQSKNNLNQSNQNNDSNNSKINNNQHKNQLNQKDANNNLNQNINQQINSNKNDNQSINKVDDDDEDDESIYNNGLFKKLKLDQSGKLDQLDKHCLKKRSNENLNKSTNLNKTDSFVKPSNDSDWSDGDEFNKPTTSSNCNENKINLDKDDPNLRKTKLIFPIRIPRKDDLIEKNHSFFRNRSRERYVKDTNKSSESSIRNDTYRSRESSIRNDTNRSRENSVRNDTNRSRESSILSDTYRSRESSIRNDTNRSRENSVRNDTNRSRESSILSDTYRSRESSIRNDTNRSRESLIMEDNQNKDQINKNDSINKPSNDSDWSDGDELNKPITSSNSNANIPNSDKDDQNKATCSNNYFSRDNSSVRSFSDRYNNDFLYKNDKNRNRSNRRGRQRERSNQFNRRDYSNRNNNYNDSDRRNRSNNYFRNDKNRQYKSNDSNRKYDSNRQFDSNRDKNKEIRSDNTIDRDNSTNQTNLNKQSKVNVNDILSKNNFYNQDGPTKITEVPYYNYRSGRNHQNLISITPERKESSRTNSPREFNRNEENDDYDKIIDELSTIKPSSSNKSSSTSVNKPSSTITSSSNQIDLEKIKELENREKKLEEELEKIRKEKERVREEKEKYRLSTSDKTNSNQSATNLKDKTKSSNLSINQAKFSNLNVNKQQPVTFKEAVTINIQPIINNHNCINKNNDQPQTSKTSSIFNELPDNNLKDKEQSIDSDDEIMICDIHGDVFNEIEMPASKKTIEDTRNDTMMDVDNNDDDIIILD